MAIFDTTVADLRARIDGLTLDLGRLTAENQRLKSPLSEGYANRIAQLEAELAHWQACHGFAADLIVELQAENRRLRATIAEALDCNDKGRHCNVCSTNMRSAIDYDMKKES